MTILDAGDIAPEQAGALFDVALGEFLFLTQFAEAVANNHGGIVTLRPLQGKRGTSWRWVNLRMEEFDHRS